MEVPLCIKLFTLFTLITLLVHCLQCIHSGMYSIIYINDGQSAST